MNDFQAHDYIRGARLGAFSESFQGYRGVVCQTPSMTDQQFLKSARITSILARYQRTGTVPQRVRPPIPFEMQTAPELNDFQAVVEVSEQIIENELNHESAASDRAKADDQGGATAADKAAEPTEEPKE